MSLELRRLSHSRDDNLRAHDVIEPLISQTDDNGQSDHGDNAAVGRHARFSKRVSIESALTGFSDGFSDLDSLSDSIQDLHPSGFQNPRYMWIRNALINGIFVLLWYCFSVTLSVYNKWMFSEDHLNFNFPIMTTAGHQVVQTALAGTLLSLNRMIHIPLFSQKSYEQEEQHQLAPSRESWTSKMSSYIRHIVPCAAAGAGDIGFGNESYRRVTLSFYTMVKSSSLGFVLMFGILFALEKATWKIVGIITVMTVGVIMMAAGEANFQALGFVLVLLAAMCSGLRWSLTQILLRRTASETSWNTRHDPIRTILYLSPVMACLLFVMGLFVEGIYDIIHASLWHDKGILLGIGFLILPGVLAFCTTLAEFFLLQRTSVLTLSIVGIAKEIVTIVTATLFFGDKLTLVNGLGLMVTIGSILAYNWYRYMEFVAQLK